MHGDLGGRGSEPARHEAPRRTQPELRGASRPPVTHPGRSPAATFSPVPTRVKRCITRRPAHPGCPAMPNIFRGHRIPGRRSGRLLFGMASGPIARPGRPRRGHRRGPEAGVVGEHGEPDPYLGEIVGTATLILLGDGVVAGVLLNKSKAQNSGWIVITWAWGMAVFIGVLTSLAVAGGVAHLNPAVTIGLWAGGYLEGWTFTQVMVTILCEFIGAFIGALLVWLAYLPHWPETEDPGSEARGLLHRAGDPQHRRQPDHGDHRHVHARVRRRRDRRSSSEAVCSSTSRGWPDR